MSSATLKEQILAKRANVLRRVVRVPGLEAPIEVRMMTLGERIRFLARHSSSRDPGLFAADLLAQTACDENGERLFGDDEARSLTEIVGEDLDEAIQVAVEMNGLNRDAVEDAEKN